MYTYAQACAHDMYTYTHGVCARYVHKYAWSVCTICALCVCALCAHVREVVNTLTVGADVPVVAGAALMKSDLGSFCESAPASMIVVYIADNVRNVGPTPVDPVPKDVVYQIVRACED